MQGLDVRSQPHHRDRTTRAGLAHFGAYLHWLSPALPSPLMMEWSDTLILTIDGQDPWIIGPELSNPLRTPDGATVVPDWALDRLARIADSGVPFHRVAIAHELNLDGPVRHELAALQCGPRTCTEKEARKLVGEVPADPKVAGSVRLLDVAISGAISPKERPDRLEPRVLGSTVFGVTAATPPRHGDLCLWYSLASWRW
jgi:hypothetical protein